MVNYCCVFGCGRNSRQNKHLNYYSLPKERERQILWLRAAKREDLLKKDADKLTVSHRFCSRHFPPSSVKNRHLCPDAVPSLFLPGSKDQEYSDSEPEVHSSVVCDSCSKQIEGYRYKCVTCPDYDLCMKCEMRETHSHHYMLRIPRPLKFKLADNLVQKWRTLFKVNHVSISDVETEVSGSDSNDDVPIVKYFIDKPGNEIRLPDKVKDLIKAEVTRALTAKRNGSNVEIKLPQMQQKKIQRSQKGKRKREQQETQSKRSKADDCTPEAEQGILYTLLKSQETVDVETKELEFADVNEIKNDHFDGDIKIESVHHFDAAVNTPMDKITDNLRDFIIFHGQGNTNM